MQKYNINLPVGSPRFDFYDFVSMNKILNFSTQSIHGKSTISTVFKDVWGESSNVTLLTNAETMSISSASTADTSAGTGARTIRIYGLDASGNEIQEDLLLNGTTPGITTLEYWRVNDLVITTAGSGGQNAGIIKATSTTSGIVTAHMAATHNRALQSHYTVPVGKYFFSRWALVGATAAGKSIRATLFYEPFGSVRIPIVETYTSATCVELTNNISGIFPPLCTLYVKAQTENGTASFALTYNGYVIPESMVE